MKNKILLPALVFFMGTLCSESSYGVSPVSNNFNVKETTLKDDCVSNCKWINTCGCYDDSCCQYVCQHNKCPS